MSRLTLTYFDFDGGRGEPARLALAIGGIEFDDRRVSVKDWPGMKATVPFKTLPVLEVDGRAITQSNTINRYVGRLTNLYPSDPWQAAQCDEVMDAVEDIGTQISATISMKEGPEKKSARERLAEGPIPLYLTQLQGMLEQRGGEYFVERRLTVADLKTFVWIRHLRSGHLDHIPKDLPDRVAPALVKHLERVKNVPAIVAFYDKRRAAAART